MKRPWCWSVCVPSISKQTSCQHSRALQPESVLGTLMRSLHSRCDLPLGNATCTSFLRYYHNLTSHFIDFQADLEPVVVSTHLTGSSCASWRPRRRTGEHSYRVALASKVADTCSSRRIIVKLMSTALTGFFYTTTRIRLNTAKMSMMKYDPRGE